MPESDNVKNFPDPQQIKEEAAAWVTLVDRGPLSDSEQARLEAWLKRSKQHAAEYRQMVGLWKDFDSLGELRSGHDARESLQKYKGREQALFSKVRMIFLGGIAASLLLVAVLVTLRPFSSPLPTQQQHLQTAFGEQQTFSLVDGSSITLNTDSIVDISYTQSMRIARLMQGEAQFDVAHDPNRRFIVYAGNNIVRVMGTVFVVRLHRDEVEVTVAEGQVELLAQIENTTGGDDTTVTSVSITNVVAGDNVRLQEDKVKQIVPLSDAALSRKLSWRRGLLSFAGEPLIDVINEVNRYTRYEIEIADDATAQLPIGGYFKVGEVQELLLALENTFDLEVEQINETHVRLNRSP